MKTRHKSKTVQATCNVLDAAGISYTINIVRSGHVRINAVGLPPVFCSLTTSDHRAVAKAESFIRRLLKNPPRPRDIA